MLCLRCRNPKMKISWPDSGDSNGVAKCLRCGHSESIGPLSKRPIQGHPQDGSVFGGSFVTDSDEYIGLDKDNKEDEVV